MDNALRLLRIEREQARLGKRPEGSAVSWEERATHEDVFAQHQWDLPTTGLRAKLSLWISGNNDYPDNALIGFKVEPQQPIMTFRAPYVGTPWHISVGFSNDDGSLSAEALAFISKYSIPREVTLRIKEVRWNAVTDLADNDPIVSDPIVHAFHQSSYYRRKAIHITF